MSRLSDRVRTVGDKVGIQYHEESYEKALSAPIYQFCVFVDPGEEHVFLDYTHNVKATRWTELFCDVVPQEGGKAYGVAATLERFGLEPEEAVAFGDGENDLSMFEAVGTSVAMGNAWDSVKERATFVTNDVDDNGIYHACRRLGFCDVSHMLAGAYGDRRGAFMLRGRQAALSRIAKNRVLG